ncbi:hypothetical protein BC936DRAFT_141072 [Jimgerdemannia flammicorona]|uniref:Uncharacterized protein n=1 Tax=Jimgerdemannia flammicorona TaxID=994334 RepID=A0A433A2X7_9FUNG|nr:hypothetical protein BC936DRAFT_141072 [Jimgerdemannia flammicorona]
MTTRALVSIALRAFYHMPQDFNYYHFGKLPFQVAIKSPRDMMQTKRQQIDTQRVLSSPIRAFPMHSAKTGPSDTLSFRKPRPSPDKVVLHPTIHLCGPILAWFMSSDKDFCEVHLRIPTKDIRQLLICSKLRVIRCEGRLPRI